MPELPESLFQGVFEASPNGVVLADEEGRVVAANARFAEMLGYAQHELEGRAVEELVPASYRSEHQRRRREFLEGTERRSLSEVTVVRRDGVEFPVQVGTSFVVVDGRRYLIAAVSDISARRAAEQDLAAREQRLRALMEHASS